MRREVAEETGLVVETAAIVEVLDKIVVDAGRVRYHYVLVDFLCFATGGALTPGSDAEDVQWVALEELRSHGIYRLAPVTIAVIEKALGMAEAIRSTQINTRAASSDSL